MKKDIIIFMDMDGTITEEIIWKDIHRYFGTLNMGEEHFKMFLKGKITYDQWMKLDTSLWGNPNIEEIEKISKKYTLKKGVKDFVDFAKKFSHIIILSSGLDVRAKYVAEELDIDEYYTNELIVENGKVVGAVPKVGPCEKGKYVKMLKEKYGAEITIGIGDSVFDRSMFENTDTGFVFNETIDGVIKVGSYQEIKEYLEEFLKSYNKM